MNPVSLILSMIAAALVGWGATEIYNSYNEFACEAKWNDLGATARYSPYEGCKVLMGEDMWLHEDFVVVIREPKLQ